MSLINVDFKQIEVVIAAHQSQDEHLISMLKNGKDIHKFLGSRSLDKLEDHISDVERTACKTGTFQLFYGAGPKTIGEKSGRGFEWAKQFLQVFFEEFPRVKEWHNELIEEVERNGRLTLWDGVTLEFQRYPAVFEWQIPGHMYYLPTEIKNWPIQHLAGLIMAVFAGTFMREKGLHNRDKYLIINTVHDSLMLDCRPEFVDTAKKDVTEIVDKIPEIIYDRFKEKIEVPIKVDISIGERWSNL
jgi:DNA polymerase I